MLPNHAKQLIAKHLAGTPRPHLLGLAVAMGVVAAVFSLGSNEANAVRSEQLTPAQVAAPIDLPDTPVAGYTPPADAGWRGLVVKSGDTLSSLFARAKLSATAVANVLNDKEIRRKLHILQPGREMRLQLTAEESPRLLGLDYPLDDNRILSLRLDENGNYTSTLQAPEYEYRQRYTSGVVSSSLYEAALTAGLSDNLTMELADIFGWDIDFALDIRQGDSFTVLYEDRYHRGERVGDGDILAAEFTNQGKTYSAYRYVDASGYGQYYSADGKSVRKAFLRTPVDFRRISSRFGNRTHPIYGTMKRHTGVDYAAKTGTPIRATGDGKIVLRGVKGGYGKTVIIQHGNVYSTLYGHMNGYAKGMVPGRYVRQGQVIGYVGATGTATGPHLHYEFRVYGVHRNPLTVKLPDAEPVRGPNREAFQQLIAARQDQFQLFKTRDLAMTELR